MNLRDRIAKLEQAVAPHKPLWPLVVVCHRVGDYGEHRAPGVYYDGGPGSVSPTVVYEGDDPPEAVLAQFRPRRGAGPLIISFGPDEVPAPNDDLSATPHAN